MASWRPLHHEGYVRRIALAALVGALVLALLAYLGPSPQKIAFWEGHTGAEGELRLLPELSLVRDEDELTRLKQESLPRASQGVDAQTIERPPEPPPNENPVVAPLPKGLPREDLPWQQQALELGLEAGPDPADQAALQAASQRSLDFVLTKFVRPRYPTGVPASTMAREILVHAAMYVDERGKVAEAYIVRSDGGPLFDREVLLAVRQWEYRPVVFDRAPRPFWDQVKITFIGSREGQAGKVTVSGS